MVRRTGWILCAVIALTVLPYCTAAILSGHDFVFGGFLLNPLDGNSYLAKMRQGWDGNWQFYLPFTADQGKGSYLFLFYLFLGHAARLLHIPLVWMFHLARIASTILLVLSLSRFITRVVDDPTRQVWTLVLVAFGGGIGWIAFFFGLFTSDFWVAEVYPFLSAYANPHFPLALAILCWLVSLPEGSISWRWTCLGVFLAALLAIISPFSVLLGAGILAIRLIWDPERFQPRRWIPLAALILGGFPLVIYQVAAIMGDPLLRAWNDQNLTPTPPWWDLLIALSPALLFAVPGIWKALRRRTLMDKTVIAWVGLSFFLMVLPFGLQRRMMTGLYIPLSILAVEGIEVLSKHSAARFRRISLTAVLFSLPTTVFVLAAGIFGAVSHDRSLYMTAGEKQAFNWVEQHSPKLSILLCSPELGGFVPGWTGRKVIYGHPFETIQAEEKKSQVEAFYQAGGLHESLTSLDLENADFIFWGPREQAYSSGSRSPGFSMVYEYGDVQVYDANSNP
jgi:hypothetical protein